MIERMICDDSQPTRQRERTRDLQRQWQQAVRKRNNSDRHRIEHKLRQRNATFLLEPIYQIDTLSGKHTPMSAHDRTRKLRIA